MVGSITVITAGKTFAGKTFAAADDDDDDDVLKNRMVSNCASHDDCIEEALS